MHIQQIEIDNFKSFSGRTVIPFRRGFTTVSGPNGSGKSNIVDSVLFCLGLSSSRTMRAEKLTDLINNLSRKREAQVTITFNKTLTDPPWPSELLTDGDPITQPAPAALLDDTLVHPSFHDPEAETSPEPTPLLEDGDLVTISRRIKETPSGYTSTYYLNGQPSTLTGIHEYLAGFNVSPGCYNVMMQGDVASIVNMSPLERRRILDELAGIAEFDRKIEQAQQEMLTTLQTVERNQILLGEIESRVEQLTAERDKALEYKALKEQVAQWEGQQQIARLKGLEAQLSLARENVSQAQAQQAAAQTQLAQLKGEITKATRELMRLNEAVKRKGEDQHLALQKQIEGLKALAARKTDAIAHLTDRQKEARQTIDKLTADNTRLTQVLETFDAELALLAQQEAELFTLHEAEAASVERINQQMDALTEGQSDLTNQRAILRQQMETLTDELAGQQRQQLDIEAERERHQREQQRQQQADSDRTTKQQSLQKRYDTLAKEFDGLDETKQTQEERLKTLGTDRAGLQAALNRATDRVAELNRSLVRLEAQQRAYAEVNFARSVELILNSRLPGVHGTLAQLGTVDETYALALEIALGGRLQNIVVDDDRVAQQGIELLKSQRAGRATFLPLTKIRRGTGVGRAPGQPGVVDYAVNLMRFSPEYDDIFAFALGDTLIVEDMVAARPLLNRFRMVTLDGSLLEKSGAMTGGSTPQRGGGKLLSSGVSDVELATTRQQLEQAQQEQARIQKQVSLTQSEWEDLQEAQRTTWQRHSRLLAELETLETQLTELAAPPTEATGSADTPNINFEEKLAAIATARQATLGQQEQLQATLTALEAQLNQGQLDELRNALAEAKFQLDYYDSQLRNTRTSAHQKQVERQIRAGAMADHGEQIALKTSQIEQFEREKAEQEAERHNAEAQIITLEDQQDALDEELKSLRTERDAAQEALLTLERTKSQRERQVAQADEQIVACKARTYELEPQVRQIRLVVQAQGVDLAQLDTLTLPDEATLTRQIEKAQRGMQALEPVNMLAIAEYDTVQARRQELADKVETLTRERDNLEVKIAGYEDLKRVYFMKAFEAVNQQFKTIYGELADGVGQLVLTQPDQPLSGGLTIEASPRGKKTQRLEAMSGGEKSLTSLAFVFSLQRYSPAPFYALDEVDQNLDGLNVEKLSRMIARESATAQFVVVSLRKPMIENSDRTVGVTQKKNGISKVTGIQLRSEPQLIS